jgi:hypothetical protein
MSEWLIIGVDLTFSEKLKPITNQYRGDLQPDGSEIYFGMHFVGAPALIRPGERLPVRMVLRAYPEDPCTDFQVGQKVFLKEGPLTRAVGIVLSRTIHQSHARTVLDLVKELDTQTPS